MFKSSEKGFRTIVFIFIVISNEDEDNSLKNP